MTDGQLPDASEQGRKAGICDECGYRITDGHGTHAWCQPEEEPEPDPKADWPECGRHGEYPPGEKMCPDCFDNARMMGANPLGGR